MRTYSASLCYLPSVKAVEEAKSAILLVKEEVQEPKWDGLTCTPGPHQKSSLVFSEVCHHQRFILILVSCFPDWLWSQVYTTLDVIDQLTIATSHFSTDPSGKPLQVIFFVMWRLWSFTQKCAYMYVALILYLWLIPSLWNWILWFHGYTHFLHHRKKA